MVGNGDCVDGNTTVECDGSGHGGGVGENAFPGFQRRVEVTELQ